MDFYQVTRSLIRNMERQTTNISPIHFLSFVFNDTHPSHHLSRTSRFPLITTKSLISANTYENGILRGRCIRLLDGK
jgi:hypothetical protein